MSSAPLLGPAIKYLHLQVFFLVVLSTRMPEQADYFLKMFILW